ncbi:GspH/FimT family pseudopilin [Polaromonas sp.]|uniref:GspH/FimT family pseudopilin n=1 Tax=Polaromonas sp. TaxID=1869339 RepID=UPI003266D8C9
MRSRGFSLIELMVTITVLALILMGAMPSIGTWLGNLKVRNSASSISDGLQQARAEAIRRNEAISFWLVSLPDQTTLSNDCALSSTAGSWVVSMNSPVGACAAAASTTVAPRLVAAHPVGDGGADVTVAAFQANGTTAANQVTFDGFGRVINTGPIALVNVSKNATVKSLRIVVNTAGSVRMCDPTVVSTTDPRRC